MGFRFRGLGFRGFGFKGAWDLGFRGLGVWDLGSAGLGFMVYRPQNGPSTTLGKRGGYKEAAFLDLQGSGHGFGVLGPKP